MHTLMIDMHYAVFCDKKIPMILSNDAEIAQAAFAADTQVWGGGASQRGRGEVKGHRQLSGSNLDNYQQSLASPE